MLPTVFDGAVDADRSCYHAFGIRGDHSGEVNDVANCLCRKIVAANRGQRRQYKSQFLKPRFCSVSHGFSAREL